MQNTHASSNICGIAKYHLKVLIGVHEVLPPIGGKLKLVTASNIMEWPKVTRVNIDRRAIGVNDNRVIDVVHLFFMSLHHRLWLGSFYNLLILPKYLHVVNDTL